MGVSHRSWRYAIALVIALLFLLVGPPAVHADEAVAEQAFQEGLAAMKRNDFAVACDAFAQSNKNDPSPGTQINLALCFEKRRMWASAWTWYRSATGLAQQRGQKEREQLSEDSANRLKSQLHYVVIAMKESPPDLVVKRDGSEVSITVGGKELPLPIDPGQHTIEVSARGKKPWSRQIEIADNAQTERVDVPKLEDAPVDSKPKAGADFQAEGPVTRSEGSSQRTVGIVVGAAGILSGLAAGGVYILAKNQESERDDLRNKALSATSPQREEFQRAEKSKDDAAKNDQLIAMLLGAGGVVLIGVGAVLFFTAPKGQEKPVAAQLTPLVGPNFAGMGLGGSF